MCRRRCARSKRCTIRGRRHRHEDDSGGHFADAEDRERALRYAMQCGFVDSSRGLRKPAEIDEAIDRIDRALAD